MSPRFGPTVFLYATSNARLYTPRSPHFRPKGLSLRQYNLHSGPLGIHRALDNIVPPPLGRIDAMQCKGKEYDQRSQRQAQIQTRRGQEVEPAPPLEMPVPGRSGPMTTTSPRGP